MVLAAIGAAMVGSLFASDEWYTVTYIAGEVKNPKRNIPLSLVLGAGIVILLYFLANVAYVVTLPVHGSPEAADVIGRGIQFAQLDRVGTAAAAMIFGAPAAIIMAVLIMISTFGCNNGLILSGARVYYAMAKDGLFFRRDGQAQQEVGPGHGPRRPVRLGQPPVPVGDIQRPPGLRRLRRPRYFSSWSFRGSSSCGRRSPTPSGRTRPGATRSCPPSTSSSPRPSPSTC